MAAVIYTCRNCLNFWADVGRQNCEKCGCMDIDEDWVEENDYKHPDLEGFYEREYIEDEEI